MDLVEVAEDVEEEEDGVVEMEEGEDLVEAVGEEVVLVVVIIWDMEETTHKILYVSDVIYLSAVSFSNLKVFAGDLTFSS